MNKSLVISALQNACYNQGYPKNIIFHSDRGPQYASNDYIKVANQLDMSFSYSKKGYPFDNASMESFHASLKKDEVYLQHYNNFDEDNLKLFDYIEGFYNKNRIHSAINYMTPVAFENKSLSC